MILAGELRKKIVKKQNTGKKAAIIPTSIGFEPVPQKPFVFGEENFRGLISLPVLIISMLLLWFSSPSDLKSFQITSLIALEKLWVKIIFRQTFYHEFLNEYCEQKICGRIKIDSTLK